jgi:hypothetical protein
MMVYAVLVLLFGTFTHRSKKPVAKRSASQRVTTWREERPAAARRLLYTSTTKS